MRNDCALTTHEALQIYDPRERCRCWICGTGFSVWWFKKERLVAAFVMSRPEEERELAPKWIMERTKIDRRALTDGKRCLRSYNLQEFPRAIVREAVLSVQP